MRLLATWRTAQTRFDLEREEGGARKRYFFFLPLAGFLAFLALAFLAGFLAAFFGAARFADFFRFWPPTARLARATSPLESRKYRYPSAREKFPAATFSALPAAEGHPARFIGVF